MKQEKKAVRKKHFGRFLLFLSFAVLLIAAVVSLFGKNIWDGNRRFTIVIQGLGNADGGNDKSLAIFSLEPNEKQALYMLLPDNLLLDVPFGYNTYPAASVYHLGELEIAKRGGFLLRKSIETTLGVATDSYAVFKDQFSPFLAQDKEEVRQIKSTYFTFLKGMILLPRLLTFSGRIDTNLGFIDRWHLWQAVRKLRIDQIDFRDLSKSSVLREEKLPDGTLVFVMEKELFDAATAEDFQDAAIRLENISLEIVNATQKERLAGEFSRILEHMGGNVISKTTAEKRSDDRCLLYFSSPKLEKAAITSRLKQLYHCLKKDITETEEVLTDIKIVLGEGFIK